MSVSLRLCQTTILTTIIMASVILGGITAAEAADVYKYLNEEGTLVFTDNLSSIPSELRDKVEKITMPGSEGKDDHSDSLKDFTDTRQLKHLGATQLRKGKATLYAFLQNQKVLLGGYVIASIILFVFLSRMLSNLGTHLLKKFIFKMIFLSALFCGAYFWYLSYLDKNILDFDSVRRGRIAAPNQLTTPVEMLKKTKEMIDQINTRTQERQELLDRLE